MFSFELRECEDSFFSLCVCVSQCLAKRLLDPSKEEMDSWQVLSQHPYRCCSQS